MRVAQRVGVGPERVAGQPAHVEHRPHVDAAAQDRIGRRQRVDQPLDRHRQQRRQVAPATPSFARKARARVGRVERAGRGDLLPAHRRGAVEQALGRGHRPSASRSSRRRPTGRTPSRAPGRRRTPAMLSRTHFSARIRSSWPSVAAVGKARVEPGEVEVAERVQPVVDRHHHDVAARGERMPVVQRIGDAAVRIGAAVDVDHHRPLRARVGLRRSRR